MTQIENYQPCVHVIVLNWHGWCDTIACLQSLKALDYPHVRLTVVDNASTDDSVARIRQAHPDVHLLVCDRNYGFAEGNNIGIRYALEQGADYVWILNNDTIVAPDSLSKLVAACVADPAIGTAGPKIYYADPPDRLWFAGAIFRPWLGLSVILGHDQIDDHRRWETQCDASFITGCAMLVRSELFSQIGLFDPIYFFMGEDLDFGMRARTSGWRNVYVPAATIRHKVSSSSGGAGSPFSLYYSCRNWFLLMQKHARVVHWPGFLLLFGTTRVVKFLLLYLLRKRSYIYFKAVCLGIWDAMRSQYGPASQSTLAKLKVGIRD